MNLHTCFLAMAAWLRDIQSFDPSFKIYGDPYPDFKSEWDDRLYSLIFTGFGKIPNPAWRQSKNFSGPTLTSRFLDILESRSCRRNYQDRINRLEDALKDAVARFGEATVASLSDATEIELWGDIFVSGLQKAGFK